MRRLWATVPAALVFLAISMITQAMATAEADRRERQQRASDRRARIEHRSAVTMKRLEMMR